MFTKNVFLVFSQNFQRNMKFCPFRKFNYRSPACFNYTLHSYSTIFSAKEFKYSRNMSCNRHFPSANFWTCVKLRNSVPEEEKNPHLVKITFVKRTGEEIVLSGVAGQTVMAAAIKQDGIMQASCDGQLACTTCHVYVDPTIKHLFSDAIVEEEDLLDNAPFCKPNSRLSCQLVLTEEMTEARFGLPAGTTNMSVDSNSGKSKT